jgi:hypothetical protein
VDDTRNVEPGEKPVVAASPSGPGANGSGTGPRRFLRVSNGQFALALAIAAASDALGAFVTPAPPLAWLVDVATAVLLFGVLGWQWLLLPGLLLEAIPGVGVLPFWLLVVGAIGVWGTARRNSGLRLAPDGAAWHW